MTNLRTVIRTTRKMDITTRTSTIRTSHDALTCFREGMAVHACGMDHPAPRAYPSLPTVPLPSPLRSQEAKTTNAKRSPRPHPPRRVSPSPTQSQSIPSLNHPSTPPPWSKACIPSVMNSVSIKCGTRRNINTIALIGGMLRRRMRWKSMRRRGT